jgi:hypothetical protein
MDANENSDQASTAEPDLGDAGQSGLRGDVPLVTSDKHSNQTSAQVIAVFASLLAVIVVMVALIAGKRRLHKRFALGVDVNEPNDFTYGYDESSISKSFFTPEFFARMGFAAEDGDGDGNVDDGRGDNIGNHRELGQSEFLDCEFVNPTSKRLVRDLLNGYEDLSEDNNESDNANSGHVKQPVSTQSESHSRKSILPPETGCDRSPLLGVASIEQTPLLCSPQRRPYNSPPRKVYNSLVGRNPSPRSNAANVSIPMPAFSDDEDFVHQFDSDQVGDKVIHISTPRLYGQNNSPSKALYM